MVRREEDDDYQPSPEDLAEEPDLEPPSEMNLVGKKGSILTRMNLRRINKTNVELLANIVSVVRHTSVVP